jgi:hypothetical protein
MRIAASALEGFVIRVLCEHLRDPSWIASILPYARGLAAAHRKARELATNLERQPDRNTGLIRELVSRIEMDRITMRILLNRRWLLDRLVIRRPRGAAPPPDTPVSITTTGHRLKCGMLLNVVLESPDKAPEPDHRLVREILRAIRLFDILASGSFISINDLARSEKCCAALISDRIRLAFLAPDIVEMILEGKQPSSMTIASLKRACPLPASWEEQHLLLIGT